MKFLLLKGKADFLCVMKIGAIRLQLKGFQERNMSSYTYPEPPPRPLESGEELHWEASFHLLSLQEGN